MGAELPAYLALGALSGAMAGLFGLGGGLIVVPGLLYLFDLHGLPETTAMHLAIGTSLATVVLTASASTMAHQRHRSISWRLWTRLTPGLIAGAALGAFIAGTLPGHTLRTLFGVMEILIAVYVAAETRPTARGTTRAWVLPWAAFAIGLVCAIMGIGGGTLIVPLLLWVGISPHEAVGTSAAAGLPTALAGALGFALLGTDSTSLPSQSSGYIYWPAFAGIAATSVLSAPLGAALASRLSARWLRHLFALLLFGLGGSMFLEQG